MYIQESLQRIAQDMSKSLVCHSLVRWSSLIVFAKIIMNSSWAKDFKSVICFGCLVLSRSILVIGRGCIG